MKWPKSITIIRHGLSGYNRLKGLKSESDLYKAFRKAFEENPFTEECRDLAQAVAEEFSLGYGDYETPLAESGIPDIVQVGKNLPNHIGFPDVVVCSPYFRTKETLKNLAVGWPKLQSMMDKVYYDPRVREKEHGLANLYNDWRVMQALHPEQNRLYQVLGPYWYRYPQGESMQDVRDRIQSWTATLIREFAGQEILVVTHHLTIISMLANFQRLSPEQFIDIDENDKPINVGVTVFEGDPKQGNNGRLILKEYNKRLY